MSAYVVNKAHIDLIVTGIVCGTRDGVVRPVRKSKDKLGQMLVTECVKSVSARYPDDDVSAGALPGPCDAYYTKPYRHENTNYLPTAAELAKAIGCYTYQSCEHSEWESSEAFTLCEKVKTRCETLKEMNRARWARDYDAASWGFDVEDIAICFAKSSEDGRAFLTRIAENRNDAVGIAVFSDWLKEQGFENVEFHERFFDWLNIEDIADLVAA